METPRVFRIVLLVLGLCAALAFPALAQPAQGSEAPPFKATDVHGQEVDLAKPLPGNPDLIILLFFSMETGKEMAEQLKQVDGRERIQVVAVGHEAEREALRQFAEEQGILYYVIPETPDANMEEKYGPFQVLPLTYIIAAEPGKDASADALTVLKVLHGGGAGQAGVINYLAQLFLSKRQADLAASFAGMAKDAGEDARTAEETAAYAHAFKGDTAGAKSEFERLGAKDGLAYVALAEGDAKTAAALAEQAGPENGFARTIKAKALLRQGDTASAATAFEQASRQPAADWQKAEALNGHGRMQQQQGKLDEASSCYQQAGALNHYDAASLSNLGAALREKGDLARSVDVLDAAGKRGIEDPLIAVMLKQVQQELKSSGDTARREQIRAQITDLEARYKSQKAAGADKPADEWTTKPMIVAFLPGQGAGGVFFERAGMDTALRREVAAQVDENSRITVVDREMLDTLLQELNLGSSELADPATQARLGKVLSAQLLGFVDFARAGSDNAMFVRMVDTETTSVACQVVRNIAEEADLAALASDMADELAKTLEAKRPVQGLIADTGSGEDGILINLGKAYGLEPGQTFEVLEEGKPVEIGGKTLHRNMAPIATIQVKSVEEELASCGMMPGTLREGAKLAKGMKVREVQGK